MEITRLTEINKGSLLGFANVYLPEWNFYINDISIFQKGNLRWINFPQKKVEDNGEVKYFTNCGFKDKDMKTAFEHAFFHALAAYKQNNQKIPEQDNLPF